MDLGIHNSCFTSIRGAVHSTVGRPKGLRGVPVLDPVCRCRHRLHDYDYRELEGLS